jgi:hypothetical protein
MAWWHRRLADQRRANASRVRVISPAVSATDSRTTPMRGGPELASYECAGRRYLDRFEGLAQLAWNGGGSGRVWMSIVFEQEFPSDE